jgi:hypothetical protein
MLFFLEYNHRKYALGSLLLKNKNNPGNRKLPGFVLKV